VDGVTGCAGITQRRIWYWGVFKKNRAVFFQKMPGMSAADCLIVSKHRNAGCIVKTG
jgi:hypothetical protein